MNSALSKIVFNIHYDYHPFLEILCGIPLNYYRNNIPSDENIDVIV